MLAGEVSRLLEWRRRLDLDEEPRPVEEERLARREMLRRGAEALDDLSREMWVDARDVDPEHDRGAGGTARSSDRNQSIPSSLGRDGSGKTDRGNHARKHPARGR